MRALLVSICSALFACTPAPTERVIVARAGTPDLSFDQRVATVRVTIAGMVRQSQCVRPNQMLSLRVPAGVDRISFAVGVRPPLEGGPSSVRFTVRDVSATPEVTLFEERARSDGEWIDARVDLPRSDEPRRLRLSTSWAAISDAEYRWPPACWGSLILHGRADGGPEPTPNVVFVSLDTLGADFLGYFDGSETSPHLDALLERSFTFRNAYVDFGNTFSSHSSLFTGLHPNRHQRYGHDFKPMHAPALPSLVAVLAAHGYRTVAFTENAYVGSSFGFDVGFDQFDNGGLDLDFTGHASATFARAEQWVKRHGPDAPYFLFVHTYQVHTPYRIRDAAARRFAQRLTPDDSRDLEPNMMQVMAHNNGDPVFEQADLDRMEALYRAEIHYLDRLFAAFVETLDALATDRDTLIVIFSDHGELFGEQGKIGHGAGLHNRNLHVPLAFYWPGRIEPGSSDAIVQLLDTIPTLFDLLGIATPDGLDGRSLAPLIRRSGDLAPRPAYAELFRPEFECRGELGTLECIHRALAVQTGRYKLVRTFDGSGEWLFDLDEDPAESRDVAKQHPQVVVRHRALLDAYLARSALGMPQGPADAKPEGPDAKTREHLRVLGYIE